MRQPWKAPSFDQLKSLIKSNPITERPARWLLNRWRAIRDNKVLTQSRLARLEQQMAGLQKQASSDQLPDSVYRALEDRLRGSTHDINVRFEAYDDWITKAQSLGRPAADLGCGRGEWLTRLKSHGLHAVGIDSNPAMLQACKDKGLAVVQGDALQWLSRQPDQSLGLVSAFHVAEHLPAGSLWALISEAFRVLVPNGILVLETPNPENLQVASYSFWFDPTHRAPLPPPLLDTLVQTAGFITQDILRLSPYPELSQGPETGQSGLLHKMLFCGQDYGLIATRPGQSEPSPQEPKPDPQQTVRSPGDLGPWALQGPSQGSYSLSIVNRQLMQALKRAGQSLLQTETTQSPGGCGARITLRNDFPPKLEAGNTPITMLANYAWEETGYPVPWVKAINQNLQALTVCTPFVKKILREAGVSLPIAVVGNGVEVAPATPLKPTTSAPDSRRPFRFIHVSTGLRRKALDVLIRAFEALPSDSSRPIELVIKTTPNPTNEAHDLVAQWAQNPSVQDSKIIQLIDDDLSHEELSTLISGADVMVMTSRAEGFGLPIAEAALLGIPSIVSAWGGHRCFANDQNAWLVSSPLSAAKSHLNALGLPGLHIMDSVWCEPEVKDLSQQMLKALRTDSEKRQAMAQDMARLIRQQFNWNRVADRTITVVERLLAPKTNQSGDLRLAWVSTFNSACGIATYSENLIDQLRSGYPGAIQVFANRDATPTATERETQVKRTWSQSAFNADALAQTIVDDKATTVLIQHNAALFPTAGLSHLVKELDQHNKLIYIDFHNTSSLLREWPDSPDILTSLKRTKRIFVHAISDLNNLAELGLSDQACLLPHGVYPPASQADVSRAQEILDSGWTSRPKVLASCFGFAMPHKGFKKVIEAIKLARDGGLDVGLLMLCAEYPNSQSQAEVKAMRQLIGDLRLHQHVILRTDFVSQEQAIGLLSRTDLAVYAYEESEESASGAVRMAVAAGLPIFCSPIRIFEDLADVCQRMPSNTPTDIARALSDFSSDITLRQKLQNQSVAYRDSHQWHDIADRLSHILQGDANDPFPDGLLN